MQPDDITVAEIFIKDIGTTSNHMTPRIRLTCYFVSSINCKIKFCIIGTEQKIRMQYFQE